MNLLHLITKYSLNIRGVIHIGAHYGQEYGDYVRNNIQNMMFFEPLKANYNTLLKNVHVSDNVKTYNIALGNSVGDVTMNVETFNNGMSSSVLEPSHHIIQYPQIRFDKKEIVRIDKLDNIPFDRSLFNFINIDVQGYELEVFKGAINTLPYIQYIMSEVNRKHLYKNCPLVEELDEYLFQFGFKREETNWAGETWGDALYIK